MFGYESKVILCCSVSPSSVSLRHSVTAIKFASKIREVLAKKQYKAMKNI